MKKQSMSDRLARLSKGRCPVHGTYMGHIERWTLDVKGRTYAPVGCPRKDCSITAYAFSIDGPWEIEPAWVHILDDAPWQVGEL